MSPKTVFQIQNLVVTYGSQRAVSDLSLRLESGQSLGLIGVNGAGKTSTLRALLGMLKPTSGTCTVLGQKSGAVATFKKVGFAPEEAFPPDFLSVREYLVFCGRIKGFSKRDAVTKAEELSSWFDLKSYARLSQLSKGMKKRLVLAQAFIGAPELLILDEPLNGLDPIVILKLRDRIQTFVRSGGSVCFSSHILSEIENCCSHVAVLERGQLLKFCSVKDAVGEAGSVENLFRKAVEMGGNSG